MRTWNNPAVHQNDIETSKGNYEALFNIESVEQRTKPVLAEYLSHVISCRCQTSIQTLRKKGKGMLAIQ